MPTIKNSFDYIIVGAGSAGCVLANRLTEDGNNRVLLIEAGMPDRGWKVHMPAALTYNLMNKRYNWYYHTEPQQYLNNRRCYWPRGKGWGGSSTLNAMVYVRGHALDYERWEAQGAKGWSYADVLPYFRKAESREIGADEYRGGDGPLNVHTGDFPNPLFDAFIEAGRQAGYPVTDDMNGLQQEGFGLMDMTIKNGQRWSTAQAYLRPVLNRPNLEVVTGALTTQILFKKTRAQGVEYLKDKQRHQVQANNEIILSGGAINSPQLLMLSGIGDSKQLNRHNIEVKQHLPGVGANLQDHLEVYLQQACRKPVTLFKSTKLHNQVLWGSEWFLKKSGWCSTTHLEAGAFIRTEAGVQHPDIQYHFLPGLVNDHGRDQGNCHAFQLHVSPMRPESKGNVMLRSADPLQAPVIQPNYLATERDRYEMRQGVRLGREIFAQQAMAEYSDQEIQPGNHKQTDVELDECIRQKADSGYHPSCTCKMGSESDSLAVVDSEARVYGCEGLRVVDASIMPSIVSGNLNAPVIMMAEKCADHILGKPLLPPSCQTPWVHPQWQDKQR